MLGKIQIQRIPWPIRLLLLVIVGIPAFTGWPILMSMDSGLAQVAASIIGENYRPFVEIFAWLSYAIFMWTFIWMFGGIKLLLNLLLAGSILGVTIALTKATLGKLPILSGGKNWEIINLSSVILLLNIMTVVPYALMFVRSFSAAKILKRVSSKATKPNSLATHFAVYLRAFQHSIERFVLLLTVWEEENPQRLLPRARADLEAPVWKKSLWFSWFVRSLWAWCIACLVNTLKAVPIFVSEAKRSRLANSFASTEVKQDGED